MRPITPNAILGANPSVQTPEMQADSGLTSGDANPPDHITLAIALTTASMFLLFSAATQMRPESTP